MSQSLKTVAVTGAGGFIASHLVEDLLASGYEVKALVHYNALGSTGHLKEVTDHLDAETARRLHIIPGDVTDTRCVRELVEGCTTVYHLAALIGIPYSYVAPQSYVQINVNGTLNVLEACRDYKIPRIIHTSTSEVYGTARTTPMNEQHPLQAQSPYAATKIAADKLVESYHLSFELPVITVRPFNTYGPRQSLRAIIPVLIAQALSNHCPVIRVGSLEPVRDFTYVTDTASAFRMVAETENQGVFGRIFNLGCNQGISIGNLAHMVLEVLEVDKEVESVEERLRPERSEVRTLISDNRVVKKEIAWKPSIQLPQGLKKTAEYIQPRLERIDPTVYRR